MGAATARHRQKESAMQLALHTKDGPEWMLGFSNPHDRDPVPEQQSFRKALRCPAVKVGLPFVLLPKRPRIVLPALCKSCRLLFDSFDDDSGPALLPSGISISSCSSSSPN